MALTTLPVECAARGEDERSHDIGAAVAWWLDIIERSGKPYTLMEKNRLVANVVAEIRGHLIEVDRWST